MAKQFKGNGRRELFDCISGRSFNLFPRAFVDYYGRWLQLRLGGKIACRLEQHDTSIIYLIYAFTFQVTVLVMQNRKTFCK